MDGANETADPAAATGESDTERALRAALALPAPFDRHDLLDRSRRVDAGVLVLVRCGAATVLMTKRPDDLRHPGEYCFPGGRPHGEDTSLLETAFREAEEEIGVPRDEIRVLGELASVPVLTSLHTVHPFVGVVGDDLPLRPSPHEVALVEELGLDQLLEDTERHEVFWYDMPDGSRRGSPIIQLSRGPVFGATAIVLMELLARWAVVHGRTMPEPRTITDPPWDTSIPLE